MGKATIKKRWEKFIPMVFSNCHANFVLVWAFNVVLKYVYVKLIRYLFVSFGLALAFLWNQLFVYFFQCTLGHRNGTTMHNLHRPHWWRYVSLPSAGFSHLRFWRMWRFGKGNNKELYLFWNIFYVKVHTINIFFN